MVLGGGQESMREGELKVAPLLVRGVWGDLFWVVELADGVCGRMGRGGGKVGRG